MKTIAGGDAIARMRQLRNSEHLHFEMTHHTFERATGITNGVRHVKRAKLRPALPKEKLWPHADLYLPYIDLDIKKPRMCFKRLINTVAFPPDFEPMQVKWY